MRTVTILSVVARIHPAVWDVIPRGFTPSPEPWNRSQSEALQIGAAEMAHELVRMAVEMDVSGGQPAGFVREFIDDWCATPWPHKWPIPWPGPRETIADGQPIPWDVQTARAVGSIVFASAGARLPDGDLGAALAEGAERLAEAAIAG